MTELEYILENFDRHFSAFAGRSIVLHGSREYTRGIAERFREKYRFTGAASFEDVQGPDLNGVPVLRGEELWEASPEMIILTERVRHEEAAFQQLCLECSVRGIALYDMYGLDAFALHRDALSYRIIPRETPEMLAADAKGFDIVILEVCGTMAEIKGEGELVLRPLFRQMIRLLREKKTRLVFSMRKSFPEEPQRALLETLWGERLPVFPEEAPAAFFEEEGGALALRRKGEDLSLRILKERAKDMSMLYIGSAMPNEYLLPRYYGIHAILVLNQYDSLAPLLPSASPVKRESSTERRGRMEQRKQMIAESDVISFDLFDTVLLRRVTDPRDVFLLTEQKLAIAGIPCKGFAKIRSALQEASETGTIVWYYKNLSDVLGWTEAQMKQAMDLELETEQSVLCTRHDILSLVQYARSIGKTVIFTSDMYLSSAVLNNMLSALGVTDHEKIFVSCEYGKTKASGLMTAVREYFGPDCRILHFDDREAFRKACSAENIQFVHADPVYSAALLQGWTPAFRAAGTLQERCLLACIWSSLHAADETDGSDRSRYAASVAGPVLAGYVSWLCGNLMRGGYDTVLFFARDGWLVRPLYEYIRQNFLPEKLPASCYFYTSRHAAHLVCASREDVIRQVCSQCRGENLNARQMLEQVYSLDPSEILPEHEAEKPEEDIVKHYLARIRKTEKKAKNGYLRYMDSLGLKENARCAVVDFFSSGTSQRYLQDALPLEMTGFYAGNYKAERAEDVSISYYFKGNNDTLFRNFIELESCFSSPEPSVDRVDEQGEVRFAEEVRTEEELTELRELQQEALAFAEQFFRIFPSFPGKISPEFLEEVYAVSDIHMICGRPFNDLIGKPMSVKAWSSRPGPGNAGGGKL